jgi:hypothetical protein
MDRSQRSQVRSLGEAGISLGKVVIVSTSSNEQRMLEEVYGYHNSGQFSFETTVSFGQDAVWWSLEAPEALVLVLPDDEEILEQYYTKLQHIVPRSTRILFLTPVITPRLMKISALFEFINIVKSPVEPFFLYRALVDLTTQHDQRQKHPRYLTEQSVRIEAAAKAQKCHAVVRNMSVGGMYFELPEVIPSYRPGDLLRVTMENSRKQTFDAKVVWTKTVQNQISTGYGCAFLSRDQVLDILLSRVPQ